MKMSRILLLGFGLLMVVGVVSAQERGSPEGMKGSPLFSSIDGNGDGIITPNELDRAGESLRGLDRNNDGNLDSQEIGPQNNTLERRRKARPGEPARPGQPPNGNRNQPNDRGPNGKPGAVGNTGGPAVGPNFVDRLFQFDKDNDGKLSREELATVGKGRPNQGNPGQGNNFPHDPRAGERRDGDIKGAPGNRMEKNMRRPEREPSDRVPGDQPREGKGKGKGQGNDNGGKARGKTVRGGDGNEHSNSRI